MSLDCVLKNGTVSTASETYAANVGIADGKIVALGLNLPEAAQEIDIAGKIVVPGAIDVHTHFDHYVDYIGSTNADDYESGTRAAAVGGITTIVNFAFQAPGESLRKAVDEELANAEGKAHVDYGLHLVPTDLSVDGVLTELRRLAGEGMASIKAFTAVTGYALSDPDLLTVFDVANDEGLLVNVHAEDQSLIGHLSNHLKGRGCTGVEYLTTARPPLAEALATRKVGQFAHALRQPVYFVHLSCRQALEEVRRCRSEGTEVYVETRPVYLYLDDGRYQLPDRHGNKYVCLPPLRSLENQNSLWTGLRNGEIQTYATDHAPWQSEQKMDPSLPFDKIPAGVSNVQTSIGMLYAEGVQKGRLSLNQFVAVTSTNPAKLFGMWPNKGTVAIGADADLTVLDPGCNVGVSAAHMQSQADYDPYEGYQGVGWPVMTLSRGEVVAQDGKCVSTPGRGRFVVRDRYRPL